MDDDDESGGKLQHYILVPTQFCQKVREILTGANLFDPTVPFLHRDGKIGVPYCTSTTVDALKLVNNLSTQAELVEISQPRNSKKSNNTNNPYQDMCAICQQALGDKWREELLSDIPRGWEKHGDLALLPSDSFVDPVWGHNDEIWTSVCQALKVKRLAKKAVISNDEFRSPNVTLLWGVDPSNTWVKRTENGIHYTWDITKSMFSVGNITEKLRLAQLDCTGQTVVDLFAGIGYFTITYLVHSGAEHVHACEWNPKAIEALKFNLDKNGVAHKCTVYEGDNRTVCPKNVADHVNLGLIPSSEMSYGTACKALKQDVGGVLHIHGNVETNSSSEEELDLANGLTISPAFNCQKNSSWYNWSLKTALAIGTILKADTHKSWAIDLIHLECVKSFKPKVHHLVLDLKCSPPT